MSRVRDVMTRDPVCIGPDAPIREALTLMKKGGFRRLPVTEGDRLVGIVSDRDLRRAMNVPYIVHERKEDEFLLDSIKVGTCMTTEVYTLSPQDTLQKAAALMKEKKIGGCPVLDGTRIVGIVTESDLLDYLLRCLEAGRIL